jgi:hypothetical protein
MATIHGRGGILTIPEIAKYLKVTQRTIHKLEVSILQCYPTDRISN